MEASDLSVRQTLREIGICRSTFYDWYARYLEDGVDGLAPRKRRRARQWNAVPESVREAVVQLALERTELSPRELACRYNRRRTLFRFRINGLPDSESTGLDHQSGLRVAPTRPVLGPLVEGRRYCRTLLLFLARPGASRRLPERGRTPTWFPSGLPSAPTLLGERRKIVIRDPTHIDVDAEDR